MTFKPHVLAISLEKVKLFLSSRIGKHEMIAEMEIRDALPKTIVGELSKKILIEEEAGRRAQSP